MFLMAVTIIFILSFVLAVYSLKSLNEKPPIKDVKRSLDKHRIIFHGHSSKD